jgi:hypothetical protein
LVGERPRPLAALARDDTLLDMDWILDELNLFVNQALDLGEPGVVESFGVVFVHFMLPDGVRKPRFHFPPVINGI